jgi:uncharacterized phage-associated protein
MVSAHDVAAYILEKYGPISAMKLQKLVYYAQAWSLVWDDRPLFSERIEAWANGPVVRDLYDRHRGKFEVRDWPDGDPGKLSTADRATLDAVLGFYGDKPAQWLSDLTHSERPWREARRGAPEGAPSTAVISPESMRAYYGSL